MKTSLDRIFNSDLSPKQAAKSLEKEYGKSWAHKLLNHLLEPEDSCADDFGCQKEMATEIFAGTFDQTVWSMLLDSHLDPNIQDPEGYLYTSVVFAAAKNPSYFIERYKKEKSKKNKKMIAKALACSNSKDDAVFELLVERLENRDPDAPDHLTYYGGQKAILILSKILDSYDVSILTSRERAYFFEITDALMCLDSMTSEQFSKWEKVRDIQTASAKI